jgi:hypothetical protein
MFITFPTNEIRFNWIRRKYNDKHGNWWAVFFDCSFFCMWTIVVWTIVIWIILDCHITYSSLI